MRARKICWARTTDVTTAMPGAASVQPWATHCRRASSIGSKRSAISRSLPPARPRLLPMRTMIGRSTVGYPRSVASEPDQAMTAPSPSTAAGEAGELHVPVNPVRLVTAASLFDGHDAAINIVRRLLVAQGAEVIHLGHNRSVDEIVRAALDEDVQGVAVSSYQGGHLEFFEYLVDLLGERGRPDIRVYGGGGGVIVPAEIERLQAYGVAHVFSPDEGQRLGLAAMVNLLLAECDRDLASELPAELGPLYTGERTMLA